VGQEYTAGADQLVRASVCASTQRAYETVWPRWRLFLHALFGIPAAPDTLKATFIPFSLSDSDIARLVGMFSYYLFNTLNLNPANVIGQLSALRYQFAIRNGPTNAWHSDHLSLVRRGLARQPATTTPGANRRLPFTLEMVLYIYRKYCNSRFFHRRARAAAVVFAFCCLLRPSEYLWGTQNNVHDLTGGQVEFECSVATATNSTTPTTTFITLAGIRGIPWSRVRLLRIHRHSAKNISSRTGSRLWFSASGVGAIHLVRVMYDWGQHAQALNSTPVFSWPTTPADTQHVCIPQRTNLLYRDFHELL
jgi:hypothetical protein